MSNPTLIARLGLDEADFKRGLNASQAGLSRLQNDAKVMAAQLALLKQEMYAAGGGSEQQAKQLKTLETALRATRAEAKEAAAALKALEDIKPPTPPPLPTQSQRQEREREKDKENGKGNKRGLAHSARAVVDMTLAGQSPMQAVAMEAPRVVDSMGGGLGAILGVGAALGALNAAREHISEIIAKAKEMRESMIDALRPGPSRGAESTEQLLSRVKELDTEIKKSAPAVTVFEKLWEGAADRVSGAWTRVMTIVNSVKGPSEAAALLAQIQAQPGMVVADAVVNSHPKVGYDSEVKATNRTESEKLRKELLDAILEREKRINEIREQGFSLGEARVRVLQLETEKAQKLADIEEKLGIAQLKADKEKVLTDGKLPQSMKDAKVAQIDKDLEVKEKSADPLQKQVDREYGTEKKKAEIAVQQQDIRREERRDDVLARQPGIADPNGGEDRFLEVSKQQAKDNPEIKRTALRRDAARRKEQAIKQRGGDTKDAHLDSLEAEADLRDRLTEQAMLNPQQRTQQLDRTRQRRRAQAKMENVGRRHEEVQRANDSMDPIGDARSIPDNKSIPDNASPFDRPFKDRFPRKVAVSPFASGPDLQGDDKRPGMVANALRGARITPIPPAADLRPQLAAQAGSANKAGEMPKVDNEGIIAAVNAVKESVDGISLTNR